MNTETKFPINLEDTDDFKRLYLKGKIDNIICPLCKKKQVHRFKPSDGEYLSYPKLGKTGLYFLCNNDDCEASSDGLELPIEITDISVTIKYDVTKVKLQ